MKDCHWSFPVVPILKALWFKSKTVCPQLTTASQEPGSLLTVIFAGTPEITGEVLSTTVTICVAVAAFPAASVAVHVTVVDPNGKIAGASFTTEANSQLSPVTGVPNAIPVASQLLSPATVTSDGAVIVGNSVSLVLTISKESVITE